MKNSRILFFLLIGLLIGISSCRDDEDRIVEIIDPNPGLMIEGTVSGQVTDSNGNPIDNAIVSLEGERIATNQNGLYSFSDMPLMEGSRVVLKVSKADYFETSRAFTTTKNRSIVNFELVSKIANFTTVVSTNEAALNVSVNGLTSFINIPPNAYVLDGTSAPYDGPVRIFMSLIDPSDRNSMNSIPGDLGGIDANGEEVQLGSFSMLAVNLESPSGQKLNLMEGMEAAIRFAIPAEYVDNAPATIPLWHYDLDSATWREEGSANISADENFYEGTVTHFSFWNCDAPFPLINLSGRVVDENGLAQPGVDIRITILSSGLTRGGQTDSNGEFLGKVPSGERLKIEYSRRFACVDLREMEEIGPFESDAALDDYTLTFPNEEFNTLSGRVLNCDGQASPTSFILFSSNNGGVMNFIPDNNGNFSITIPTCWTNIVLNAFDFDGGFTTDPILFPNGIVEDIVVPDLSLCTEDMSFVELIHEGTTYRNELCEAFFKGDNLFISASMRDSLPLGPIGASLSVLDFGTTVIAPGDYITERFRFNFVDDAGNIHELRCNSQDPCDIDITIESVGPIGGFITGSYSGTVRDTNTDFPDDTDIIGTFSALRQN